ncbi:GerMN domain-containing protein [Actinoplanes sp. NPDC049668]|uniref:GerMN domain-containing protein n=1 Tax=unclassified Actinoplanes TaxID=2626549 RepID=UPI0033A68C16
MTSLTRLVGRFTTGLVTATLITSCGLPADSEPHQVDLPRRALTSAAAGAAATDPPGEAAEVLCLVRDTQLVQTVRRVNVPPTAQRQAEHLVAGPTEAERGNGLTTALATTAIRVAVPAGSTQAQVEIAETDEGNARSDETIAYGQIVCTLTARADVDSVVFTREGEVLQVPRADGSLSRGPLRAGDYASLVAPS